MERRPQNGEILSSYKKLLNYPMWEEEETCADKLQTKMKCKYCKKEYDPRGIKSHERACLKNPDKRDEKGRFKPGHGIVGGRPKGSVSITRAVKEKMMQMSPDKRRTFLQLFVDQIVKDGIVGNDKQARKMIWNYIDGLPTQALDVKHDMPQTLIDLIKNAQTRSNTGGGSKDTKEDK